MDDNWDDGDANDDKEVRVFVGEDVGKDVGDNMGDDDTWRCWCCPPGLNDRGRFAIFC